MQAHAREEEEKLKRDLEEIEAQKRREEEIAREEEEQAKLVRVAGLNFLLLVLTY